MIVTDRNDGDEQIMLQQSRCAGGALSALQS